MKNAPVRHAVEWAVFKAMQGLVRLLPHSVVRSLGGSLGNLAFHLLGKRRRTALKNLALALPERKQEHPTIARSAFRHMTSQALEMLAWQRYSSQELCRRWTLDGFEHLTEALNEQGAAFLMTGHLGCWELLGPVATLYAEPSAALVRPLDNPRLDQELRAIRGRDGLGIIEKHGAARSLTRSLRGGERLLVLMDQRVRARDAVTVPFFGHPARTTNLIARLALKYQTPIVPIYAFPEGRDRYRIVVRKMLLPGPQRPGAVEEITQRCLAAVESEIRLDPGAWLWMHDRWKQS